MYVCMYVCMYVKRLHGAVYFGQILNIFAMILNERWRTAEASGLIH